MLRKTPSTSFASSPSAGTKNLRRRPPRPPTSCAWRSSWPVRDRSTPARRIASCASTGLTCRCAPTPYPMPSVLSQAGVFRDGEAGDNRGHQGRIEAGQRGVRGLPPGAGLARLTEQRDGGGGVILRGAPACIMSAGGKGLRGLLGGARRLYLLEYA